MEKVLCLNSWGSMKPKDGLDEVNEHLQSGWQVKLISACAMGDSVSSGQAYVVQEKKD